MGAELLAALLIGALVALAGALVVRIRVGRSRIEGLERHLADASARLDLASQAAHLGMFEQDLATGRISFNARYAQIIDGVAEPHDPHVPDLMARTHPDDLPAVLAMIESYRTGDRTEHEMEFRILGRDGGWRWIRTVGRREGTGTPDDPLRIVGVGLDVTEQRSQTDHVDAVAAERATLLADSDAARRALLSMVEDLRLAQATQLEALEHYRGLIAHAPVPIFVNRGGRIAITNQAMVRLLGVADERELIGRSPLEVFAPADHERVIERIDQLRSLRTTLPPAEYQITRKDGSTVEVEASASPFDDDGDVSIHVVFRDISEQKRAEEALVALNAELEARVRERTGELENAYRELESFSYSVSHDLRAPLRAITGFSQILERRYAAQLDETGRHYLDNISTAGERMGTLIEDLLSYSRVGRRDVRREPLDVGIITDAVAATLAPRIIDAGASVGTDGALATPMGDPTLFQQVLQNLIANGIIYARPDVPPDVTVRSVLVDGHVEVSVQDNGMGIAPEHHERVFEVFARLHTEDEIAGTGIGLAIVRKAARLMDGDVSLESTPGAGSRFILRLPAAPATDTTADRSATHAVPQPLEARP